MLVDAECIKGREVTFMAVHRMLAVIEATLVLLCIITSGGVAVYMWPAWVAYLRRRRTAAGSQAEGMLAAEELIGGEEEEGEGQQLALETTNQQGVGSAP